MRLIRVMCSGRIDLEFILRAFLNGEDGVFVGGCKLGECNYVTHGNYDAMATVYIGKKILSRIGLDPERLRIQFMSGADGNLLAEANDEFSKIIKAIGPLGQAEGEEHDLKTLMLKLEAARLMIPYLRFVERELLRVPEKSKEAYVSFYSSPQFDAIFDEWVGNRLASFSETTIEPTLSMLGEDTESVFSDILSQFRESCGPALSYKRLIACYIDPSKCRACMTCARKCPVGAIESAKGRIHVIDQEKCVRCGTCVAACPPRFAAISWISGDAVPLPLPEADRAVRKSAKNESRLPVS